MPALCNVQALVVSKLFGVVKASLTLVLVTEILPTNGAGVVTVSTPALLMLPQAALVTPTVYALAAPAIEVVTLLKVSAVVVSPESPAPSLKLLPARFHS